MPAECALCAHPDRAALDALLLAAADGVVSEVARRAGVSRTSVRRHRDAGHHRALAAAPDPEGERETPPTLPPEAPPVRAAEEPRIEVDEALFDLLAEQAEQARRDGTITTRERPGARQVAKGARREATLLRLEKLVTIVEGFLEEASEEAYSEDLSGRARLVTACNGALTTLARILGELNPEAARHEEREKAILEVLLQPEHRAAAGAVRSRLVLLEKRA